jgi:TolB-like protein/Flp pilus assembly protein TadD
MITFHVLGTLALRGPAGGHLASPVVGSKRLALLSYLALATPRGPHRRDTLLALLWPEATSGSARNSLSNMIFQIRSSLGREVFVASGDDEIGLAEGVLWCDAVAFEEALDDGREEEALDLYRGDLLAGFFVSGASAEFDHWLDARRERLRGRAADAARVLTDRAEQAGSLREAIGWTRRTFALDPYGEPNARRLIALLDRSGDRAGALQTYESFAQLLGGAFGTDPSAETKALIQAVLARSEAAEPGQPIRALAVLPFENLSGTGDAEAFTAGLHDDLLTELSRVSALSVIARTSVLRYRGATKSAEEIGRELGVGTLLEGAVQTSGGRLRLNVQLIDARTGVHRWVGSYDRELSIDSIFDIQSELVEKISRSLRAELSPSEKEEIGVRQTGDLEAYRLCAQGRRLLDQRTEGPVRQAAMYFDQAIKRDSEFPMAWVGLADALSLLHDYGYEAAARVLPRAEQAIRRALTLDAGLAEAHASLGLLHSNRREGPASVRELQRAVELRPGYADAHNWLGWTYQCLGRREAALECATRAVRLNPLSREAISNLSVTYLANGHAEAAVSEARRLREIEPGWSTGAFYEALALYRLGRFEDACDLLQGLSVPWVGSGPRAALALAYVACHEDARVAELLLEFEAAGDRFSVGLIHAARGDVDRAFDAFGRVDCWGDYWPTLSVHQYYPDVLGPLRADPRFHHILREVNRTWGVMPDDDAAGDRKAADDLTVGTPTEIPR